MNLLQKLAVWTAAKAVQFSGLTTADPRWSLIFGGSTYTGKTVTPESAMSVSALWACVRILCETTALLPLKFYQKDSSGNAKEIAHDKQALLDVSPNAYMTGVDFKESIVAGLCIRGTSFIRPEYIGSRLVALTPIPGQFVQPQLNAQGQYEFYVYETGKPAKKYTRDELWIIPGFGSDGTLGLSPIAFAKQSLGLAMAAEEFGGRVFSQGARPGNVIEMPTWIKDGQREAVQKRLDEQYAGLANMHKTMILEAGMKLANISMPLDDAQFILTRKLQVAEVCRFYRVPLHLVMEMEGSTNNNIEHQTDEFIITSLKPYTRRIEASVNKFMLTPKERSQGIYAEFDYDVIRLADTVTRAQFYASMTQNGIMSRNEVRVKEKLPRVDGLDEYTVQSNLIAVDALAKVIQGK